VSLLKRVVLLAMHARLMIRSGTWPSGERQPCMAGPKKKKEKVGGKGLFSRTVGGARGIDSSQGKEDRIGIKQDGPSKPLPLLM